MAKLFRNRRRDAIAFLAATALTLALAQSAFADDLLGQLPAPPANSGTTCTTATSCTFFQAQNAGSVPTYIAPYDGIVTGYAITQGSNIAGVNTVQLRSFRPAGGSTWLVAGQSLAQPLFAGCCGPISNHLPARVPVKAGDHIGITVNFDGNTAWDYASGNAGDVVAQVSGVAPSLGDTIVPLNLIATASRLINVQFMIEPDADGDGFGDDSQDLCPGDPTHGDTACSGYVLGSNFQHPTVWGGSAGCGAPPCVAFNTALSGASTAAPLPGVIVRWRVRSDYGNADLRLHVLHPDSPSSWSVGAISDVVGQTSDPNGPATIRSDARIPIRAGDYIGIASSTGGFHAYWFAAGAGDEGFAFLPPTVGASASPIVAANSNIEILYNADVEPDADADGYGDLTQDQCPTEAEFQSDCPKPAITNFKSKRKKFRVNPRGDVIRASSSKGTTFSFDLSKASTVQYVVSLKQKGKRKGRRCVKRTAKNRRAKNCTYFKVVHFFRQTLTAGKPSFVYSGRYARGKRAKQLKPGTYRITAVPTSTASAVTGDAATASFKVARR